MPFPTHKAALQSQQSLAWALPSWTHGQTPSPLQPDAGTALNCNHTVHETTLLYVSSKAYLVGVKNPLQTTLRYACQAGVGLSPKLELVCSLMPSGYIFPTLSIFSISSSHSTACSFAPQAQAASHGQCWASVPQQCFSSGNAGTQTCPWLKMKSQTHSSLTILYLKAPSNFSPRWQDPLLSITTTT